MGRCAVFASDANLTHFKFTKKCSADFTGTATELGTPESLSYKEWTFHSLHKKMLDCNEMCQVARDISAVVGGSLSSDDHIDISDHTLKLPAIIFGNDIFSMQYCAPSMDASTVRHSCTENDISADINLADQTDSVLVISVDARDALCCWAAQHTQQSKDIEPLLVVQVPCAKSWNERSLMPSDCTTRDAVKSEESELLDNDRCNQKNSVGRKDNRNIWDWTFTSDYCCSLEIRHSESLKTSDTHSCQNIDFPSDPAESMLAPANLQTSSMVLAPNSSHHDSHTFDTAKNKIEIISARYLSNEVLPLFRIPEGDRLILKEESVEKLSQFGRDKFIWRRTDISGIDFNLLRMQNVPILFYDEILLYEDDLEDCGDVNFDAKLRVMPTCWYVLSRFFVRVDGTIVRIRDTRLFHRFGDKSVHMEITWKECNLRSDSGKESMDQILTNTVLRNPGLCAEKIPCVNKSENIHTYFVLDLH